LNSRISIRPALLADAPVIARVHVDSWRTTYRGIVPDSVLENLDYQSRAESWQRGIADTTNNQRVFVAEAPDGEIVGFVASGPERTGDYPDYTGEIYAIYVRDSWQGQGLGWRLIEAGARSLVEQGHRSMLIWALSENPACGFYRKLGGVRIATQVETIGQKALEETAFGWKNIAVLLER
jgi:ribosomal protein S18 acetylase RimI-like enzyme